jgi:hypothetical protein
MRRPSSTTLDPAAFDAGRIARGHCTVDGERFGPDALALVLDALVDRLPEPERSVLQGVAAGLTNAELGRLLGYDPAFLAATGRPEGPIERKTVWRWKDRGAKRLAGWLEQATWLHALAELPGKNVPAPTGRCPHTHEGGDR